MNKSILKLKAIEQENKKRILKLNPNIDEKSGIYFFTRKDEDGISYFYIGQSVNLLQRCASHLSGYQHIDLSLKKRGLFSPENPLGWKLGFLHYPKDNLDKWEQYWILEYTKQGYQCRYNKTGGSQGEGKEKINEYRPAKGYRDGLQQGMKNLAKELHFIAEKHLKISVKEEKSGNKVSERQLEKFMSLINPDSYKETEQE